MIVDNNDFFSKLLVLQQKSPLDIVNVDVKAYQCEMMTWFMVVEDDFGQERFFSEDPVKQLDGGNFTKVPMLLGRTEVEFVDVVQGKEFVRFFFSKRTALPKNFFQIS